MQDPIYVAFATQKGGAGKSTLTTLVASYLHYVLGKRVLALDCDPRQHSMVEYREKDKLLIRENPVIHRRFTRFMEQFRGDAYEIIKCSPSTALDLAEKEIQKGEPPEYVFFDIPALLNETADRFDTPMRLADKTLVREIDPAPLVVNTDREALIKMISNLLNNARKYGKSTVRLSLTRNDKDYVIKVASDGPKIKTEDRDRIFLAFYQTDSAAEIKSGVGIGLPLSRSLAALLGGSLVLEDNPSETGNIFTLTLPIVEPVASEPAPDPEIGAYMLTAESNQAKRRPDVFNILLVEDNANILKILSEQLSNSFVVTTAHNGVEALEKLKVNQPDLILTDIMMPEMNGLELCNAVKSDVNLSHIPLVFITAKNDLESKIQGLKYGAEAYVEKPFSIKYLRQLISSILDNRRREREAFTKNPFYTSGNAQVGEADREFIERARSLIEEHISDENLSVDILCEQLNMSRSALLRKIKSVFGLSPHRSHTHHQAQESRRADTGWPLPHRGCLLYGRHRNPLLFQQTVLQTVRDDTQGLRETMPLKGQR